MHLRRNVSFVEIGNTELNAAQRHGRGRSGTIRVYGVIPHLGAYVRCSVTLLPLQYPPGTESRLYRQRAVAPQGYTGVRLALWGTAELALAHPGEP